MSINFAVIGINHAHIEGQVDLMLRAGARFVSFFAAEDDLAKSFSGRYPQARRVAEMQEVLDDESVAMVLTAAIPADRAAIAIAAMRHGKDVMTDKPGVTSFEQLAEVKKVQQETGRIFSICYSEHFETKSTVKAGELVQAGAIGRVINIVGLGPHAVRLNRRPEWFYKRDRYGGILCDIGSHQCEQFLFFSGTTEAEVMSASVFNRAHPDRPGLQDFGDMHLKTANTTGYVRLDWFTPDGLDTWGDGRLFLLGTEGYIEIRKYIDVAGRPGTDHLFIADKKTTQYIDCTDVDRPYGRQLVADVLNRTETAMSQAHCYAAMDLALRAQQLAEKTSGWQA